MSDCPDIINTKYLGQSDTLLALRQKKKGKAMLLNNSRLADDKSLQAWAGHSDAAFTKRQYMDAQEEQLQKVCSGFSEYISSLL